MRSTFLAVLTVSAGLWHATHASAQELGAWRFADVRDPSVAASAAEPWIQPDVFRGCLLDQTLLRAELATIPQEAMKTTRPAQIVSLPMPDGAFARFRVYESPIMEPALAAQFPEIKTYVGQGIDIPGSTVRFDLTPAGFHSQVLSPSGAAYIDPYWKGNTASYAVYWKRDYRRGHDFSCGFSQAAPPNPPAGEAYLTGSDGILHTYRVAVAATGEYTAFHGGTVPAGQAAIVTAMNRVVGVYENDLSIRMVLVANNSSIVYTNSSTDPYTNSDGFSMLGQNQTNLTNVIGSANYDIGHVFSTGGGGVAGLGVVCVSSQKARGVTGHSQPVGDPFTIDYVAHEMGHQFGANHSFNSQTSSCCCGNRNAGTAYEHGSGNTIMAYAGICGSDNLQPNSDPYFHSVSLDEIRQFVTNGSGSNCDVATATGNTPPVITPGGDYAIPANTPFELTGSATDPDGDHLSFAWEQRDLGPATTLAQADNGTSPIERPWNPMDDPVRTIPRLSNLLVNTVPLGERYPTANRLGTTGTNGMDWRLVVRDNRAGGGCFVTDDLKVQIVASAGPFQVTSPNTNITASGALTVTWNPANTIISPINALSVDILLSVDGGLTYPYELASATSNDGSEVVGLPDFPTTTARIKVRGTGNIFFDVSNTNFAIEACSQPNAPAPDMIGGVKNRFLSIDPEPGSLGVAWQVIPVSVPAGYESLLGQVYWVGDAQSVPDPILSTSFWAAQLQCDPVFGNWGSMDMLHIYGPEVVPGADYEVRAVRCDPENPDTTSDPTVVSTTVWGDVAPPYQQDTAVPQPDVIDVSGITDRLKELPTSIDRVHAALSPGAVDPAASTTVIDISTIVDVIVLDAQYSEPPPALCPP